MQVIVIKLKVQRGHQTLSSDHLTALCAAVKHHVPHYCFILCTASVSCYIVFQVLRLSRTAAQNCKQDICKIYSHTVQQQQHSLTQDKVHISRKHDLVCYAVREIQQ